MVMSVVLLLAACSPTPTDEEYVSNARGYIDNGQWRAAVIELKNAVSTNPDNVEARFLLGSTYLSLGDVTGAEVELTRAQKLGVREERVLPLLSRLFILQRKFQEILDLSPPADFSTEEYNDFRTSQGLALIGLNRTQEARNAFREVLARNSEHLYGLEGLARLEVIEGRLDEAREHVSRMLSIDEEYGPAWSILGHIQLKEADYASADESYSNAIKFQVLHTRELLERALVRIELEKFDQAEEDLAALRAVVKTHPELSYMQGLMDYKRERYRDAVTAFETTLSLDEEHMPAMLYAGATYFKLGNFVAAQNHLNRYLVTNPNDLAASQIVAMIRLAGGDAGTAEKIIRTAAEEDDMDVVSMVLLANALIMQDKTSDGIEYLTKVINVQPGSASTRTDLAEALLKVGDKDRAIEELTTAVELDPKYEEASTQLVLAHLKNRELDKALAAATAFRDANPDSPVASNLLAFVHMSRNETQGAIAAFSRTLELSPGDPSANSGLAAIAIKAGDYQGAKGYYRNTLEKYPGDLKTLLNLASLEALQSNDEAVETLLQQAIEYNPAELRPRLILARFYFKERGYQKVIRLLFEVKERYPGDVDLLMLLSEAYFRTKDFEAAKVLLLELETLVPNDPNIRFLLAKSFIALGEDKKGEGKFQNVLELDPMHKAARVELIKILISRRDVEEAEAQLRLLRSQAAADRDSLVLEAAIAELKGDTKSAIVSYEMAFEQTRNNYNLLRLANAKWAIGEREEAITLLESWLAEHPDDVLTLVELGNRYIAQKRTSDAVDVFRKVLELDPANVIALNNLAWLLQERSPDEAESLARKAVEIVPNSARFKDTLAMVLLAKGDPEQAKIVIEKALVLEPRNPGIRYHSAVIDSATGDKPKAIATLEDLQGEGSEFPERADAEVLLKELRAGG